MKLSIKCDRCGKELLRCPSQIHRHNFCSRECLNEFSSKVHNADGYAALKDYTHMSENMSRINKQLNESYRLLLEKRYLCFLAWDQIAAEMHYSRRWVLNKHERALEVADRLLREKETQA